MHAYSAALPCKLWLVVLAGALVATACSSNDGGDDRAASADPYTPMYDALCEVEAKAGAGDTEAARTRFLDDAHQDLHELAEETGQSDRAAAARLLEAKQAVEQGLATMAPTLTDDLSTLVGAARAAIVAVGDPEPAPCPSSSGGR